MHLPVKSIINMIWLLFPVSNWSRWFTITSLPHILQSHFRSYKWGWKKKWITKTWMWEVSKLVAGSRILSTAGDALIRGAKDHLSRSLSSWVPLCPSLLLWAQKNMTRCICSTAACHSSSRELCNDDDEWRWSQTLSRYYWISPLFRNSGILNCGTGRIQFATPCAAVFLGLASLMLLQQQQQAMECTCLPQPIEPPHGAITKNSWKASK
jgi:hypothetical protein